MFPKVFDKRITRISLSIWGIITLLAIGVIIFSDPTYRLFGDYSVLKQGPLSDIGITYLFVGMAWLLIGSLIILLHTGIISGKNLLFFVPFYLYAFLYVNILRERFQYGDLVAYIRAAFNLHLGEPFYSRYIYPPLWASILEPMIFLGGGFLAFLLLALNYLSLLLFFILLYLMLKRFGFERLPAVIMTFLALVANVSIMRTLGYVQINLHVINLILLSLLLFPRRIWLSALALALAGHLKVSPLILIIPFILGKEWRWLIYFTLFTTGIIFITSAMHGFEYYSYFIHNLMNNEYILNFEFRDFSFDSLIRATLTQFGFNVFLAPYFIWPIKFIIASIGIAVAFKATKSNIFYDGNNRENAVFNSAIICLFLMVILSPLVWVHHAVFLIFPCLILSKRIASAGQLLIFLGAYIAIFLIPTFDFYPFSYIRTIGVILCLILALIFTLKPMTDDTWLNRFNSMSEKLFRNS